MEGPRLPTVLDEIVASKHREVAEARRRASRSELEERAARQSPARPFAAVVGTRDESGPRLIAEIKRASPSAGLIRPDLDPAEIARIYARHGAAALSVLTDGPYFQGRLEDIRLVREAVELPVLRKDFIVDGYQIPESRAAGADAVLLIAEVLGADGVAALLSMAREWGMCVLVEVHEEEDLRAVLECVGPPAVDRYLLGINNRDLRVQRTDLATTERLASLLPPGVPFISESGLATREDLLRVHGCGASAVLIGESILRSDDIGARIDALLR